MLGKTHLAGGIITSLILCSSDVVSMGWLILGSVLPDIDHPGSIIGKNIPLLPKLLKHRGFTHSLTFAIVVSLFSPWIGIGCLVHNILDMMTKNGIELLWPIHNRFRFPLAKYVKTNGKFEKLVFYLSYLFITYLLYIRFA